MLTNSEEQYKQAVMKVMKNGQISFGAQPTLRTAQKTFGINSARALEIQDMVRSEQAAAPAVDQSAAAAKARDDASREERNRLADLERKQEDARREAQRLEEKRRQAEEDARRERERMEEARRCREEEERKDRERREAEHKRQMEEQERIHKEAEKAAAMKADAERAKREAAEAKAAAELAKKDAELKAQQAKMEAKAASDLAQKNAELAAQRAEMDRLRAQQAAASAKSPQNRWVFILLGIFFGYLGVHLAYARRWILFAIFWAAFIGFVSNCGDAEKAPSGDDKAATEESQPAEKNGGNDAIAIPCFLVVAGFWLVAPFCIKKDGKKRRLA